MKKIFISLFLLLLICARGYGQYLLAEIDDDLEKYNYYSIKNIALDGFVGVVTNKINFPSSFPAALSLVEVNADGEIKHTIAITPPDGYVLSPLARVKLDPQEEGFYYVYATLNNLETGDKQSLLQKYNEDLELQDEIIFGLPDRDEIFYDISANSDNSGLLLYGWYSEAREQNLIIELDENLNFIREVYVPPFEQGGVQKVFRNFILSGTNEEGDYFAFGYLDAAILDKQTFEVKHFFPLSGNQLFFNTSFFRKYVDENHYVLGGSTSFWRDSTIQDISAVDSQFGFLLMEEDTTVVAKYGFGIPTKDMVSINNCIDVYDNGDVFVFGNIDVIPYSLVEVYSFVRSTKEGEVIWQKTFINPLNEHYVFYNCIVTQDEEVLLTGNNWVRDTETGYSTNHNFIVAKLDENGNFVTGTEDLFPFENIEINYFPNPSVREIQFDLANLGEGNFSIVIINTGGQIVFQEKIAKGNRMPNVNISDWTAGTYFFKIVDFEVRKVLSIGQFEKI